MKRILAAAMVAAMMGCATGAFALTGLHAGVKGGVNIGDITGDDADGVDTRNGFMGGAFIGGGINGQFGILLEGLYVQKGGEGSFVAPGEDHAHDSVITLDYIEFPLLFTAKFPAGEKFAFNVFAGPTFGFSLGGDLEDKEHGETMGLDDYITSFEFGAAFGAGVEYLLSSFSIVLDARYGLGATNTFEDIEILGTTQSIDAKNTEIGIMAGLSFPLGAR